MRFMSSTQRENNRFELCYTQIEINVDFIIDVSKFVVELR